MVLGERWSRARSKPEGLANARDRLIAARLALRDWLRLGMTDTSIGDAGEARTPTEALAAAAGDEGLPFEGDTTLAPTAARLDRFRFDARSSERICSENWLERTKLRNSSLRVASCDPKPFLRPENMVICHHVADKQCCEDLSLASRGAKQVGGSVCAIQTGTATRQWGILTFSWLRLAVACSVDDISSLGHLVLHL
jgi:hypothetical protein